MLQYLKKGELLRQINARINTKNKTGLEFLSRFCYFISEDSVFSLHPKYLRVHNCQNNCN
jgi:aspartyl aminopeptidase